MNSQANFRYSISLNSGFESALHMRVIYTPDAEQFMADLDTQGLGAVRDGLMPIDLNITRLMGTLGALLGTFPDLPTKIGIVTTELKEYAKQLRDTITAEGLVRVKTGYLPLDVLNSAIELRDSDFRNPLQNELVYRTMKYFWTLDVFPWDEKDDWEGTFERMGNLPSVCLATSSVKDLISTGGSHASLERSIGKLEGVRRGISWDDLSRLRDHYAQALQKNGVPEGISLHYLPSWLNGLEFYAVETTEEEVVPQRFAALGAESLVRIPDDLVGSRRGVTISQGSFARMLSSLGEDVTIVTDVYLVDHLPELEGRITGAAFSKVLIDENS